MTDKKMSLANTSSKQADVAENQPPRKAKDRASLLTNSAFPAMMIISNYVDSKAEPGDILARLHTQADAVLQGDMSQIETMLLHQAVALQSMFADLAFRARQQSSLPAMQTMTQLALRAQSSCRATLQTLAEIKNPKQVSFVKQANIAQNQQVNNGVTAPARAGKIEVAQNELIVEEKHGSKKVDARAKKKASDSDTDLVAVDVVDRTAKPRGETKRSA